MGLLIDGEWSDRWYDTDSTGGRFVRKQSAFRDWIRADGSTRFAPEAGRYRLYVSLACPWAHRTLIVRRLKGLEQAVPVTVVDPYMGDRGWAFDAAGVPADDPAHGLTHLYQVYQRADPGYTGRVTVPVLWDTQTATIVSNESSEIIRMFDAELPGIASDEPVLYPEALRAEIDAVNDWVYPRVNDGVYRCGFATTQEAYEEAFHALFDALDELDRRLEKQRWLVGGQLTEADVRLFTTLVRFDPVYVGHFKCNLRRIADYPNLSGFLRDVYQLPGVAETVDFDHIKRHYYQSHRTINPTGIVPLGPALDLDAPHERAKLGG